MGKKTNILLLGVIVISLSMVSAISEVVNLNIQTTNATSIVTGNYSFIFNISKNNDCSNADYTNTSTLTTDFRGVVSYSLANVNLNFSKPYRLCVYRDGVLTSNLSMAKVPSSFDSKNTSWEGIIGRPTNLSQFNNDLLNYTKITYDTWNDIWSRTSNSTYDTWLPNYTAFNKFWYNFTNTISSGDIYNIVMNGVITSNTSAFDDRYLHGSAEYFLTNTTSTDVATYKIMNETIPQSTSMKSLVVSGLTNTQVIESWINSNTNLTFIEAGAITAHLHLTKTTGVQALKIYANITKRNSTGEYELSITELSDALTNTLSEQEIHGVIQETFMKPTDKLVMKIVASVTGSGTAPTIKIDTEGETASRLELPIKSTSVSVVETESRFVARNVTIAGIGTTNCTGDKVMVGAEATNGGIFSKCIIAPDASKFAGQDASFYAPLALVLNLDQSTPQHIFGGTPIFDLGLYSIARSFFGDGIDVNGTSNIEVINNKNISTEKILINGTKSRNNEAVHYKMNDNSANTNIIDSSNSNNATASVNTDTIATTGIINGALNLSGQYATIPYTSSLDVSQPFSISMWVKIDENDGSGYNVLIAQDSGWALYVQNGGGGLVLYLGNGVNNAYSYTDVTLDSWHQVGVIYNGTYNLIIDGSLILDLQVGLPAPTNNNNQLILGQYTGGIEPAHATFDDIRFYSVALNSTQVSELYNSGSGTEGEINVPDGATKVTEILNLDTNGEFNFSNGANVHGTMSADGYAILGGSNGISYNLTGMVIGGSSTNGIMITAPTEMLGFIGCYNSDTGGQVCGYFKNVTDDPSDQKLKDGINPLNLDISTASFSRLKPSTWDWNNISGRQGTSAGFIAQEVEEVYPELVKNGQSKRVTNRYELQNYTSFVRGVDGKMHEVIRQRLEPVVETTDYKTINYAGIIALLTSKIQDQDNKINQIQNDNNKLKDDYVVLEKRLTELEARIK